ncbi:hypothetical protein LshimejAT787_0900390 [Lyophyllum shimeji]|uniref:Uncharacterized protein n=1 Tax=Lyophyllum shimeji TaxID=47721 RepID=A0A9P3UMT6_LYOSH|nr:hypothetical protein LshimejAT787_0900390 [Lyophyllum shimeji]
MTTAPAPDLRHMTSNPALVSPRLSQHLRTHSPARSPTSIPSSPTSVHSSSSAIFERDIEPLSPPSPQTHHHSHHHHHTTNAHRIPRSKTTEQIEHSVPSVLDSAAAILASIQNTNASDVAIVAPAPYPASFAGSGFASPIGSFRSRSPSPTIGNSLAAHGRANSLLLSIPQQQQQQQQPAQPPVSSQPATRPTPSIQTKDVSQPGPPAIVTPTSAYYSVADESEMGSTIHSADEAEDPATNAPAPHQIQTPQTPPPTNPFSLPALRPSSSPSSASHVHSPASPSSTSPSNPTANPNPASTAATNPNPNANPTAASKRLSFVSYADLLASSPTSTLPLSSLTFAAAAAEPPPHLPSVSPLSSPSAGTSLRGFAMSSPTSPADVFGGGAGGGGTGSVRGKRDSALLGAGTGTGMDDVGGEWEREGLGRGLVERLDVLYGSA